ncbi:SIR2 family protein [Sphingorhabdus lacus]|uniref:SIR2 family protein n=1 Tax=Sphingorhabdus lacus TaxID=392610 RepID=UPI003594761E
MPVGDELAKRISKLVKMRVNFRTLEEGDELIHGALVSLARNNDWQPNNFYGSSCALSEAMDIAPSIDNFLHTHRDNREFTTLGKLGIVRAIANSEAASLLQTRNDRAFQLSSVSHTWYVSLAKHLFTGVPADDPASAFANVSFIDFNYDRCLELFLIRAVKVYFQLTDAKAIEIIDGVTIIHPYGSLGKFSGSGSVEFGATRPALITMMDGIKTFTESIDDEDKSKKIQSLVKSAETLVFLGFAFHDQNVQLLAEDVPKREKQSAIRRVYGTVYGMSKPDQNVVKGKIAQMLRGRPLRERGDSYEIELFDGKCVDLFAEYWRSLSASVATHTQSYDIRALD